MLNLQEKTTIPKEDWDFPAQDFLGHSSGGIFFRHSSDLLLRHSRAPLRHPHALHTIITAPVMPPVRHSREGGYPVAFFLVSRKGIFFRHSSDLLLRHSCEGGNPVAFFLVSREGIFFRHSCVLLLRHSREGGNPVAFFLVFQLLGIRKKILSLVEVVHTDAGCSPYVVGCPPGRGRGSRREGF